jgi:beta-phosphoglucomutase-like phosphatase (HAD superfamily)
MKKGLIFDMDGVLIDSMSFHAEAMYIAIKEKTNRDINKKIVYLLEGLPGSKLVEEIFRREKIDEDIDGKIVKSIGERKTKIFKSIQKSKAIIGAKELIDELKRCKCLKAVVSGSSKEEIGSILDQNIGSSSFDFVISGDDLKAGQGKPDPAPFQTALQQMKLEPSQAIVVENSPLGVEAAHNAHIPFIITLNDTPLDIHVDFDFLMRLDEGEREGRIFVDTKAAAGYLKNWCCT